MHALRHFRVRRSSGWSLLAGLATLGLAGCQTPDLKPFASASADVATSIRQGGDRAITPLLETPVMVRGELVPAGAAEHPAKKLQEDWDIRRQTADAIVAYSAALAAIGDASAHRQANAQSLVTSVNALAASVTGANVLTAVAGNLTAKVLETAAEVKAFHDLAAAVQSADPAVTAVAEVLHHDLVELGNVQRSVGLLQRSAAIKARAPVDDFLKKLQALRDQKREEVAQAPHDATKSGELAHLDALIASAEPDGKAREAEVTRVNQALAAGKAFFAAAEDSVDAWAAAHHDIAVALQEKRVPNVTVLIGRAQELRGLVEDLKSTK